MASLDIVLRVAGPLFFLGMQCSSLYTAYEIHHGKSTNKYSPFPFISLITNCAVWTTYGSLKKDYTVLCPNISGLIVGVVCATIFHNYSAKGVDILHRYYLVSGCIIVFALACGYFHQAVVLGYTGDIMAVILMGSPLAALSSVIKER